VGKEGLKDFRTFPGLGGLKEDEKKCKQKGVMDPPGSKTTGYKKKYTTTLLRDLKEKEREIRKIKRRKNRGVAAAIKASRRAVLFNRKLPGKKILGKGPRVKKHHFSSERVDLEKFFYHGNNRLADGKKGEYCC